MKNIGRLRGPRDTKKTHRKLSLSTIQNSLRKLSLSTTQNSLEPTRHKWDSFYSCSTVSSCGPSVVGRTKDSERPRLSMTRGPWTGPSLTSRKPDKNEVSPSSDSNKITWKMFRPCVYISILTGVLPAPLLFSRDSPTSGETRDPIRTRYEERNTPDNPK